MKRKISILLVLVVIFTMAMCTSCQSDENIKTIYLRCSLLGDSITAVFKNSSTGDKKEVSMKMETNVEDYRLFKISESIEKYDLVSFIRNDEETMDLSFNKYVSGWYISSYGITPFTYGKDVIDDVNTKIEYKTVSLKYNEKTEKKIFIWVPDDYNENKKYSVIYMTDGQNLFDRNSTSYGSWNVAQSVISMSTLDESKKAIIVGIDDGDGNRDSELTPNIGNINVSDESFDHGTGKDFSDFVYNTVVPYIEKNYSVYTDNIHNSISGSSSGGIESFYIGMEHPDKFGAIGALSPAFLLFDDNTWVEYLKEKDFSSGYPSIFIYSGNSKGDDLERSICASAKSMKSNLEKINYPEEKIREMYIDNAIHNERYWRAIFPTFLDVAFS